MSGGPKERMERLEKLVIPFAQAPADLAAENADLRQQLECLEAVALELIAERDRAVAELERLSQLSLMEPA